MLAQTFDVFGSPVTTPFTLGASKLGRPIGVGRNAEKSIAVWATPDDTITARVVGPSGVPAEEIRLESGASFGDLSIVIAPSHANDGSDFLVFWSVHRVALGAHRVYAGLVGEHGLVGLTRTVLRSDVPVRLVQAVASAEGTLLLVNRDGEPMVLPLDTLGRLVGAAHLFEGARDDKRGGAQGLAQVGDEAVVIANHESGATALRRFDRSGSSTGAWLCLPSANDEQLRVATIANEAGGYTVLLPGESGRPALTRTDSPLR